MSLRGELEQFPLVDIIQLLHMTSKTGILFLRCDKGESQLVFHEGFFVSANHLNNSVRIGKVLIDMGAITVDTLNLALAVQEIAGRDRKPLIATMIELDMIDRDTAFNGLEKLIEMTIVEVLTWKTGTFSFDHSKDYVSDEYKYFPEKLHMGILLNAQGALMESMRIYDEKVREGNPNELSEESSDAHSGTKEQTPLCHYAVSSISQKVQDIFSGLKDHVHDEEHGRPAAGGQPKTIIDQHEELINFVTQISTLAYKRRFSVGE